MSLHSPLCLPLLGGVYGDAALDMMLPQPDRGQVEARDICVLRSVSVVVANTVNASVVKLSLAISFAMKS